MFLAMEDSSELGFPGDQKGFPCWSNISIVQDEAYKVNLYILLVEGYISKINNHGWKDDV